CRPKPFTSSTVMPWRPAPLRASFTSSSLWGLMIAVTSFMGERYPFVVDRLRGSRRSPGGGYGSGHPVHGGGGAEVVRALRVLAEVQPLVLLLLADPEADHLVDDLGEDERDHEA